MNKPRLPFDIEFLLESILYESPDRIDLSGKSNNKRKKSDAERLNSLGAAVPKTGATFKYSADDAYAFFFDVKTGVIMYSEKNTHINMEEMLQSASNKATAFPKTFKNMYKIKRDVFGNISAYSYQEKQDEGSAYSYQETEDEGDDAATVGFIGLKQQGDDVETVRNYLHKNRIRFGNLSIRGNASSNYRAAETGKSWSSETARVPAGRIWVKRNAISFWNSRETIVDENFQLLEKMMSAMKLDKTKFAYEFLLTRGLFAYSELTGDSNKEKLSPEEVKKLLAAQHLDSKAKKKLAGSTYKAAHLKKAAKGFDYAARADAAVPALEGHIKLKDLLNEDPDEVIDMSDRAICDWTDADAVAFIITEKCSITYAGGIHSDIVDTMENLYIYLLDRPIANDASLQRRLERNGMATDNIVALRELLTQPSAFHEYLKNGGRSGNQGINIRTIQGTIFGRLWYRKKLMSFWITTQKVVKNWNWVKNFFKNMQGTNIGNLNDYEIDWLERSRNASMTPLTKASDVDANTGKPDANQKDFISALFGDVEKIKSLPPEEIEKLNKKIHLLPPSKKREALLAMGYKNIKAIEIADALGMTVAEFNNIMNVNEGDI